VTTPFLGEIRLFSFNFAPKGWAFCNGQLLPINQNTALFSLLGTTFGGDGRSTFALPNLQGRAPMHFDATGGTQFMGNLGGEESHTLTLTEMPAHTHNLSARASATSSSPAGAALAASSDAAFSASPTVAMATATVSAAGGGQPHQNMPPYLVINFAIALSGIFPSRN
jgi:microcystin-dependent protein